MGLLRLLELLDLFEDIEVLDLLDLFEDIEVLDLLDLFEDIEVLDPLDLFEDIEVLEVLTVRSSCIFGMLWISLTSWTSPFSSTNTTEGTEVIGSFLPISVSL